MGKNLDWKDVWGDNSLLTTRSMGGIGLYYEIDCTTDKIWALVFAHDKERTVDTCSYRTIDSAKEACQKHYNKLVDDIQ